MLLNSFFFVQQMEVTDGQLKASLRIEKDHPIFTGHFPGQPVVPGVCMVQMVKELIEQNLNSKFMMTEADNIKFLSVIDPAVNDLIDAMISIEKNQDGSVKVNSVFSSPSTIFFKIKASYKSV
jgi:3-hydroxyacyl-[acyl-carrier-protein] dehydratase